MEAGCAGIYHLEDPQLRQEVTAAIETKDKRKLSALLGAARAKADKELKIIDKAHGDYAMAQLGLYENGKDIDKEKNWRRAASTWQGGLCRMRWRRRRGRAGGVDKEDMRAVFSP